MMRTLTERPVLGLVAITEEPKGRVRGCGQSVGIVESRRSRSGARLASSPCTMP